MTTSRDISQRDLRMRSREIMDAVEDGESFTVTRDGHEIAQLVPLRKKRTFVPVGELSNLSLGLPLEQAVALREAIDSSSDPYADDPYDR